LLRNQHSRIKDKQFMSTIQDVTPEQLARLIYQYREALAHDIHHEANHDSSWDHASQDDRKLMVAAARLTLLELSTTPPESRRSQSYFAVPGEAEWGC
jgi:hypothetical protein